jgi:hypothetical protein
MAVVSRRDGASAIVTFALVPLKPSAPPYRPVADQVADPMDPAFPDPEASATLVPEPSSNE